MEPNAPPPLSDQTLWMLAVRDRADRAAYARLFDFYAPRLKAMALRGGLGAAAAEREDEMMQGMTILVRDGVGELEQHVSSMSAEGWRIIAVLPYFGDMFVLVAQREI